LNLNLGEGWVVGSQPMIQYDWRMEQWNVPMNLQVAKTAQIGTLPVRIQLEGSYYTERSDIFADEWLIGRNITPVVPNFINDWIQGN
jgi:hypothetical protein